MDNLINNILEYLKEANQKEWSDHVIRYDLKRMLDDYTEEIRESIENFIIETAKGCDNIIEFLDIYEVKNENR